MAQQQARKTAYYMRALNQQRGVDLEALIKKARRKFPNVGDSEIELGENEFLRLQHYKSDNSGTLVHIARYVRGEKAATLKPRAKAAEDNGGVQAAPDGQEFHDGSSYLLVRKHNVIFCQHGITASKCERYLTALFDKAGVKKEDRNFDFMPASNVNKLKLIQQHGVRSLDLSVCAFGASIPKNQRADWWSKVFGEAVDEFRALMEKDDDAAQQKALEDIIVNLSVKLDGNSRAAIQSQKFIEKVAESVVEDKDADLPEFSIITKDGERITSDAIRMQHSFNVPKLNGSISCQNVWEGLGDYMQELVAANLLEQ